MFLTMAKTLWTSAWSFSTIDGLITNLITNNVSLDYLNEEGPPSGWFLTPLPWFLVVVSICLWILVVLRPRTPPCQEEVERNLTNSVWIWHYLVRLARDFARAPMTHVWSWNDKWSTSWSLQVFFLVDYPWVFCWYSLAVIFLSFACRFLDQDFTPIDNGRKCACMLPASGENEWVTCFCWNRSGSFWCPPFSWFYLSESLPAWHVRSILETTREIEKRQSWLLSVWGQLINYAWVKD